MNETYGAHAFSIRGGEHVLEFGPLELAVDPARGGRVTRFALKGRDILAGPGAHASNWGSTFWPSPQAAWGWPPIPEIDSAPYAASVEAGEILTLTSGLAPLSGSRVRLRKTFRPAPSAGAIDVGYTIENEGPVAVSVAPWEISRVRAGGVTFFALGPGGVTRDEVGWTEVDGVIFYANDFATSRLRGDQKSIADGVGWLAHAEGDLVFVKTFPDVPPGNAAPGEGEIEVYAGPHGPYVEIEPQGAFAPIAPHASVRWTVRWYLRQLPAGVLPAVGNLELVKFVTDLIA